MDELDKLAEREVTRSNGLMKIDDRLSAITDSCIVIRELLELTRGDDAPTLKILRERIGDEVTHIEVQRNFIRSIKAKDLI